MPIVFKCHLQIACLLGIWIISISGYVIYLQDKNYIVFFNFGPNSNVSFIGIAVDNWTKWSQLMTFTIVTQSLKMMADEIISPWIINTIMDDKSQIQNDNIDYYKSQFICQTYYLFSAIVKFIQIGISITQLDFVLAYISTDLIISLYTTHMYLKNKQHQYQSIL
jgi:hypothetical protein